MDPKERRRHWKVFIALLLSLLLLSIVAAIGIGPVPIPPPVVAGALVRKVPFLGGAFPFPVTRVESVIITSIRLPRVLLAVLVGSALAVSGAVMQGLFRNPMADPYVIGLSSGAALGASLSIVFGLGGISTPLAAFAGGAGAVFLVYGIARENGRVPVETLLLSGIAVAVFLSAVTSLIMYLAGEGLHKVVFWLMGGIWAANWSQVKLTALPVVLGVSGVLFLARDLNIILLGEEHATHLGVEIEKVKQVLLLLSALLAGVAVAMSGIIGFVGLVIPHMARIVVGPDHRILIPTSALAGGIFLLWADTLARVVIAPAEMPVGILTALVGAPFFVYLLKTKKNVAGGG